MAARWGVVAHYMAASTCYKHIEDTRNAKNVCEEVIDAKEGNAGERERSGSARLRAVGER